MKALEIHEPIVSTYTSYGCLFSITDEHLWPWICNHFIQIRYAHGWRVHAFDNHHLLLKNCPAISFYSLPKEMIMKNSSNSIKEIIIEAIDMDYYLYIYVDRYYIPQSTSYMTDHLIHELFVYGYDLESNEVLVADNLDHGKFIMTRCHFDDIDRGYWNISEDFDFWTEIRYLKKKVDYECSINLEKISFDVENYLFSRKTFDLIEEQICEFGLEAVYRLFSDIRACEQTGDVLDIRPFHLLYEHKLLMSKRIIYLMDNKHISYDSNLLQSASQLKEEFLLLRNMVIKFYITRENRLLKQIYDNLNYNLETEKQFLSDFLKVF